MKQNAQISRRFDWNRFGRAMTEKRAKEGCTQRQLVVMLSFISASTIYRAEVGLPISVAHLLTCCDWLGRPATDFWGDG